MRGKSIDRQADVSYYNTLGSYIDISVGLSVVGKMGGLTFVTMSSRWGRSWSDRPRGTRGSSD